VRALAFAQTLGLTHRDLKPATSSTTRHRDQDRRLRAAINKVSDRTIITNVGSPAYMAPELVTGTRRARTSPTSTRLGVVMYFLLTRALPFAGANTMSVIYQIVNTDPDPPGRHRQGLSPS